MKTITVTRPRAPSSSPSGGCPARGQGGAPAGSNDDARKLEDAIARAAEIFATADTRDLRHTAWSTLQFLHKQRSPEVIAQMEAERGLR